ncbi:YchJ family protein [Diaphorobacter sp.]|uniref:YchJ family protein n=1 Tax=Diaphorobacter sp. TaxID=1934310 RepID=UPI0028ADDED4|nr:YchJ family metal-binding protein [Diaphorobacter sp.]
MTHLAIDERAACPCGRVNAKGKPLAWADCCGRFVDHWDDTPAPDAESLMRSRYSAFVLHDAQYLLDTWHARTRPAHLDFDDGVKWLGLTVKHARTTGADAAEVEFVARSRVQGRGVRQQERSRFTREEGRWVYVDGDVDGDPH